jgi:hypothetical protein
MSAEAGKQRFLGVLFSLGFPWVLLDFLGIGLGFPWIPSSDSGLLNGLPAIPAKKFSSLLPASRHARIGQSRPGAGQDGFDGFGHSAPYP